MHIYIYTYRYLCSVYMNKYTCLYQYVSSRAGGAKGQPLHVCSLTWGGRLHTQRSWTHIYVYTNHIYIHLHTHIFSMHKTHPSSCAPEWGDDSCRSRASTKWGVLDPAGLGAGEWGVQAIVGWQDELPPLWGVYYSCCRERRSPSRSDWIILILNNNYWCECCPCRGRSVWTVLHHYHPRLFRSRSVSVRQREPFGATCQQRTITLYFP